MPGKYQKMSRLSPVSTSEGTPFSRVLLEETKIWLQPNRSNRSCRSNRATGESETQIRILSDASKNSQRS